MLGSAGARDGAGHRRVRHDPFEEVLRPALDSELACPCRQRLALHASEQGAFGERAVRDHGDLHVPRKRQETLFRVPFAERVVDLQEIVLPGLQPALDFGVGGRSVVRDTDVAYAPFGLPVLQGGSVG